MIGLDHVQLAMPPGGEAAAEGFYAGILGLARIPKPEPMASRGGCWFVSNSLAIHLGVEEAFRPAKKAHPALLVRNLSGLTEALQEAGITVRPNPDQAPGAGCYVEDPFGNRIELIEADQDRHSHERRWLDYEAMMGVPSEASIGGAMTGSCIVMRVPPPGSTSARMVPPSALTTWATMARPRPDPGRPRAVGAR